MNSAIFNSFFRQKLGRRMGLLAVLLALLGQGNVLAQTVEHSSLLQQHWENEQRREEEKKEIIAAMLEAQSWEEYLLGIPSHYSPFGTSLQEHLESLTLEELQAHELYIEGINNGSITPPSVPRYYTGVPPIVPDGVGGIRNVYSAIRQLPRVVGQIRNLVTGVRSGAQNLIRLPKYVYAGSFPRFPRYYQEEIANVIRNDYAAEGIGIFSPEQIRASMEAQRALTLALIREDGRVSSTLSFAMHNQPVIKNFPRIFNGIDTDNVIELGRYASAKPRAGIALLSPGYQFMQEAFIRNQGTRFYIQCMPDHASTYMGHNWQFVTQGEIKVLGQSSPRLEDTVVLVMEYKDFLNSQTIPRFLQ